MVLYRRRYIWMIVFGNNRPQRSEWDILYIHSPLFENLIRISTVLFTFERVTFYSKHFMKLSIIFEITSPKNPNNYILYSYSPPSSKFHSNRFSSTDLETRCGSDVGERSNLIWGPRINPPFWFPLPFKFHQNHQNLKVSTTIERSEGRKVSPVPSEYSTASRSTTKEQVRRTFFTPIRSLTRSRKCGSRARALKGDQGGGSSQTYVESPRGWE